MAAAQSIDSVSSLDVESYRNFQSHGVHQSTDDDYLEYEHSSGNPQNKAADSFQDFFETSDGSRSKGPIVHSDWKEQVDDNPGDWNVFRQSNSKMAGNQSAALSDDCDEDLEPGRSFTDKKTVTSSPYKSVSGVSYNGTSESKKYVGDPEDQSEVSGMLEAKPRVSVDDWMKRDSKAQYSSRGIESVISTERSDISETTEETWPQNQSSSNKIFSEPNKPSRTTFDAWQAKNKTLFPKDHSINEKMHVTESHGVNSADISETWRSHDSDVNGLEEEDAEETPRSQSIGDDPYASFKHKETESPLDKDTSLVEQSRSSLDNTDLVQAAKSRSSFEAWRENRGVEKSGDIVTMETGRTDSSLNTDVLLQGFGEKATVDDASEYDQSRNEDFSSKTINQTYSKPQKSQSLTNSDVSRKYDSYISHHGAVNSKNELKRGFVKEMLSRAKDRQSHQEDLYGSTLKSEQPEVPRASSESAKHYPRGVTLSKTFTKTSKYTPAGRKWDSSKYDVLAYGSNNIFQKNESKSKSHLGGYGTSKKYFQSDFTTKNWKIHGRKGLDSDMKPSAMPDNSEVVPDDNGFPVDASVIDDSYYKGLLVSSPIPRFSDSDSDLVSPIQSPEIVPGPSNPVVNKNNFKSNTYTRPKSAHSVLSRTVGNSPSKGNTSNKAMKKPHQPQSVDLSVEGVKQDTGSRRPNSAIGRYRTNHNPSFVDETLFGSKLQEPSFKAPWGEPDKLGKKPLPYVAITSMEPHLDRKTLPAKNVSRPGSAKSRPVSASTKKKQTKELHNFQGTYVDETLFSGAQSDYTNGVPGFKAPWSKGTEPKPYAFDATDYKAANARKKNQASTENKKPVWK